MGAPKLLKLFIIFISLFYGFFICTANVFANEETFFVATAYYSPLPNQDEYYTGSYAGDMRLNGGWNTASWKKVFPGLLAGPKNYPFGTKIYFEWYGIWVIEDRGGAIVKAGQRWYSYDRIDIWVGYGDEWLQRAKKWGKRTIKGKIVVPSSEVTLSFPESKIGHIWNHTVNPESHEAEDVKKVQIIFQKADLYDGEIDGEYLSIKDEIIAFQITSGIIKSSDDKAAGWYGPKTVSALRNKYSTWNDIPLNTEDVEKFSSFNHKQASEKYKTILKYGDLQVDPESSREEIILLQELLTELWEYSGDIDGEYKSVESALIMLQKKIGLVSDADDWGAGYFGNKTKSALWAYYENENNETIKKELNNKNSVYTLSSTEKIALKKALDGYKSRLLQAQKAGKWSMQIKLYKLSKDIDSVLPQIKDPIIKAKIHYIKELL